MPPIFANIGQFLQLLTSALGVGMSAMKKEVSRQKISPPADIDTGFPPDTIYIDAITRRASFKLKAGERRVLLTAFSDQITIIFHGIEKQDENFNADLTVTMGSSFGPQCGKSVIRKGPYDRFLVPASNNDSGFLFTANSSATITKISILRVEHINQHANEIDLTIACTENASLTPPKPRPKL
jgi:hypothetical protein